MNHLGWLPKARGELRREVCTAFLVLFGKYPQRPKHWGVGVKEVGKGEKAEGAKGSSASKMGGLTLSASPCLHLWFPSFCPFRPLVSGPQTFPLFASLLNLDNLNLSGYPG